MEPLLQLVKIIAIKTYTGNQSEWQLVQSTKAGVIGLSCSPDFADPDYATIGKLLDQIVHVADVAGIDHLGIGADFDGIEEVIEGLEDVTALPRLAYGLFDRGFSREEIDKITHKNFIRVLEKALLP